MRALSYVGAEKIMFLTDRHTYGRRDISNYRVALLLKSAMVSERE